MSTRRVIVGITRSALCEAALDWAAAEAVADGTDLVIAHVEAPIFTLVPADRGRGVPGGDRALARAVAIARKRVNPDHIQPVLRSGPAGEALTELAYAEDLLVVGAPARRHWLEPRSTTRHLLTHAPCPVVVVSSPSLLDRRRVRAADRHLLPTGGFGGHVVVGVDGSVPAHAALTFGFGYAARHRLPVAAVNVTAHLRGGVWFDDRFLESHLTEEPPAARLLAQQVEGFEREYPEVTVRRLVLPGAVVPGLVAAAEGAALLVAGTADGRFGSVVRGLVDEAVCPVAVVRQH